LNNQAAGRGAAVSIRDYYSQEYRIRHNTIAGDGTPESVAIYLLPYGNSTPSFQLENNIIASHAIGVMRENSGTLATNTNLYFDNALNEIGATSSANHVQADPQFRNLTGGDVRLRGGSPAIDNAANLGVLVDRNGVTRPQGNGYDIGAYEYVPNIAPTAAADAYATTQDTLLEIPAPGVLANDEDAESDPLAAVLVDAPANGTVTLNANGSFSYTPAAGFSGSDSFTYRADDYDDLSAPATVTIEVLPAGTNVPPAAAADAYTTKQDTALEIPAPGVLDNDQDADGDALTAVLESQPAHGAVTLNANGSFTYTPNAGYTGSDSFSYRANDGEASSTAAEVTLTVLPAGSNLPPLAFGDYYEGEQGATLAVSAPGVLANDQDGDGDSLSAVLESEPAQGTLALNSDGSFTYTPDPAFSGTDSFTYHADDGQAQSEAATVTIVVRPVGEQIEQLLLPVVLRP
jgi:VCBS repeat-containing protein